MTGTDSARDIEQLMRQQRFDEAIAASRSHLAEHPEDLETTLRLGICCLLNRAEGDFVALHDRAASLVEHCGDLPGRTAQLWQLYQRLLAKLTAPLLVMGGTSLAACNRAPTESAAPEPVPTAAGPVSTVAGPEPSEMPEAETEAPPPTASSDAPDAASSASTAAATAKPQKPPTFSAHRYSAGVYRPPKPTTNHKYSGGVYRK